jgi:alpha-D-xyloside xylohydrolase
MFYTENDTLCFRFDDHQLRIQPWGQNSLRVRATKRATFEQQDWALLKPETTSPNITISDQHGGARIENGQIHATVSPRGKMTIYNSQGTKLIEEYARHRRDLTDPKCSALEIEARELKQIFGMGQYQQPYLDLKGSDVEMAHRNSQASVPFALSSLGYGFLWNNPAIGRAVLGKNVMSFEAYSTKELDYWVTAGETPKEIVQAYAKATGYVPMMPEYGLGFWQCKLRYWNQEQVLDVAREYRRRELPIDLIVVDFFHWRNQGDWSFDPKFFPDPGMFLGNRRRVERES